MISQTGIGIVIHGMIAEIDSPQDSQVSDILLFNLTF